MDDSEIDVDVDDDEDVSDQLYESKPIQTGLVPMYEKGEEIRTPLEKEGDKNGAKYAYTVYYQDEA